MKTEMLINTRDTCKYTIGTARGNLKQGSQVTRRSREVMSLQGSYPHMRVFHPTE